MFSGESSRKLHLIINVQCNLNLWKKIYSSGSGMIFPSKKNNCFIKKKKNMKI